MRRFICLFTTVCLLQFSLQAFAEDKKDDAKKSDDSIAKILDSMGYPELQVVPRASERLLMEAKDERRSWPITHWPIELSGLTTLYVGLTARGHERSNLSSSERSNANTAASATVAIGAGWLIGGLVLGLQRPYLTGLRDVAHYKAKDQRGELLRERLSEEALARPARVMRVLQYASLFTNVGVNIADASYGNNTGVITASIGALLAFLPMAFEDHSIEVYDQHLEYKKKIYTPISSAYFHYDARSKTFTPMTGLVWEF